MFHKIYHSSVISLPHYLVPLSSNERLRLRSNVMPPVRLGSAGLTASGMRNFNSSRDNHYDKLSLKSVVEAKCHSFRSNLEKRDLLKFLFSSNAKAIGDLLSEIIKLSSSK